MMDIDDLLHRYFGTADLSRVSPEDRTAGCDQLRIDFWLTGDRGLRVALWCLMHLLGVEPHLEVAFEDEADREAARLFVGLLAAADDQ